MELTFDHLTSITHLDLQLRVIADSLNDSLVFEDVPLVDVRRVPSIVFQLSQIDLEASDFINHRADVLVGQLRDQEAMVEESVPEHQVFPHVDFLSEQL